jgi:rRNA processing protein Gar1
MGMKYIGKIENISHNGNILVRGEFAPKIGSEVFAGKRHLGKIVNIFGPVSKPYIAIKPQRGKGSTLLELIGKDTFLRG